MNGPPLGAALGVLWGDGWIALPGVPREALFSPGGNGLFLVSFKAVVDDVGVPWFEELGDCVLPGAIKVEAEL